MRSQELWVLIIKSAMILGKSTSLVASLSPPAKWRDCTGSIVLSSIPQKAARICWGRRCDVYPPSCNQSRSIFVYFLCRCVRQQDRSCAFRVHSEKQGHRVTLIINSISSQGSEKGEFKEGRRRMGKGLDGPWRKMVQRVSNLQQFSLQYFDFTVVQKCCAFSRTRTSNLEFLSFPG